MRVRFLLVAAACALGLLALQQPPTPAEPQGASAQIDFEALHAQAKSALATLQQSHEPRLASAASAAF